MTKGGARTARDPTGEAGPARTRVLTACIAVFLFWLVISASLEPLELALGLVLSTVLGYWSARFLWGGQMPGLSARQYLALARFLAGFSLEVLRAAAHVARIVLDPRLPIHPRLIVCRTGLVSPLARFAFAQAITLTPGTLTVDMDGGAFLVHCLDEASSTKLVDGELERQIAAVFEPGANP